MLCIYTCRTQAVKSIGGGHLWPSTRNANNRAKVRVGTTKRSITAIACMSQRHTQKTFAARFEWDDMLARSENDPPKGHHPLSPRVDQFCHRARCNWGRIPALVCVR